MLAAGMFSALASHTAPALADGQVLFADENLAIAVRRNLGLADDAPVTRSQAESLKELSARRGIHPGPDDRIESLEPDPAGGREGIEALVNLEKLDLRGNRVEDRTSSLSELTRLRELNLRGNRVTRIRPVAGLTRLESLNLRDNQLDESSDIPRNLGKLKLLTRLNLGENPGIPLDHYRVLEKFPLLEELGLRENGITSIEGVTSPVWHPLMADLDLSGNSITSIVPLEKYRKLVTRLLLDGNPIDCYCPVASYYYRIEESDFELDPPVIEFSRSGGFYHNSFNLTLKAVNSHGQQVYQGNSN